MIITEAAPYLGGRVAQLHRYFPKLLPSHVRFGNQLSPVEENPHISFYTMAEVTQVSGSAGNFDVTVKVHPPLRQ